jgi:hypothetical protein
MNGLEIFLASEWREQKIKTCNGFDKTKSFDKKWKFLNLCL